MQYREVPDALVADGARQPRRRRWPRTSAASWRRLFGVGAEADALRAATAAYDDLFRFKIDFVRRRALPLLKGGAHVDGHRRGSRDVASAGRVGDARQLGGARDA